MAKSRWPRAEKKKTAREKSLAAMTCARAAAARSLNGVMGHKKYMKGLK